MLQPFGQRYNWATYAVAFSALFSWPFSVGLGKVNKISLWPSLIKINYSLSTYCDTSFHRALLFRRLGLRFNTIKNIEPTKKVYFTLSKFKKYAIYFKICLKHNFYVCIDVTDPYFQDILIHNKLFLWL